jgi:hypothetical protein
MSFFSEHKHHLPAPRWVGLTTDLAYPLMRALALPTLVPAPGLRHAQSERGLVCVLYKPSGILLICAGAARLR